MNRPLKNKSLKFARSLSLFALFFLSHFSRASCEHLLLGDPAGASYAVRSAHLLGWMSKRRIDVLTPGLAEIRSRGMRGILFVSNHQSAIDGLLALGSLGEEFRLRPIMAAHRLEGPFGSILRFGMNRFNGVAIPSVLQAGRAAYPVIYEVLAEIAEQLKKGQNFYLFHNGFVQKTIDDSPEAGRALYEIMARYPDVRVVLVRQRGLWGSRYSFGYPSKSGPGKTIDVIGRGLSQTLVDIPVSLIQPLPRRAVTLTFEEPLDIPRAASHRDLNRYVQDYYRRVPEKLTLVPRY